MILEPKKIKSVTISTFPPCICHEVLGPDAMILVFWMLSFILLILPLYSIQCFAESLYIAGINCKSYQQNWVRLKNMTREKWLFLLVFIMGCHYAPLELFMVMNPYCHILFSSVCPRKDLFLAVSLTSPHEYLFCCIFLAESTLWSFYKVYSVFFTITLQGKFYYSDFNDVKTEVQGN